MDYFSQLRNFIGSKLQPLAQGISNAISPQMASPLPTPPPVAPQPPQFGGNLLSSVFNPLSQGIQNLEGQAGRTMEGAQNWINSNQSVQLPNLVPKPIANLPVVGNFAQGIGNTLDDIGNQGANSVIDTGRALAGIIKNDPSMINYQTAKSAPAKLGFQIGNTLMPSTQSIFKTDTSPQSVLTNASGVANPILEAEMLRGGGNVAKEGLSQVGKESIFNVIKSGALDQGKIMGAQGLTQGMLDNQNQTLPNQLLHAGENSAVQGAAGLVTGGALAGLPFATGTVVKPVVDAINHLFPSLSTAEKVNTGVQFVRDEAGRFAKDNVSAQGVPTTQYVSDLGNNGFKNSMGSGEPKYNDVIRQYLVQKGDLPASYKLNQEGSIRIPGKSTPVEDVPSATIQAGAPIEQDPAWIRGEEGPGKPPIVETPPTNTTPPTPAQRVSPLDATFNRTRNVIDLSSKEAGPKLAQALHESREVDEMFQGKMLSQLPTVKTLEPNEFVNMVDTVEGRAQPLSSKIAQAVQEWRNVAAQVHQIGQGTLGDIGKVENYFPHRYPDSSFQGDSFNQAIQHLVSTGQAKTPQEAAQQLYQMQGLLKGRKFANLELPRQTDLPGYDKTPDVISGYLSGAGRRIGEVQQLGKDKEKANGLLADIAQEGGDATTARRAFEQATAPQVSGQESKIPNFLRGVQSAADLGLSAIGNLTQSTNTATVAGTMRTLGAVPEALSQTGKDFALKAGNVLDEVLKSSQEGRGVSGIFSKISSPGFNTVEGFNRTLASVAGKNYAIDLGQQAARGSQSAVKELIKMGINPQEVISSGGKLTEEQIIRGARNVVERTQFKVDPQDLPGWASSPYGKLLSQFKTFSYNQSAFFKREVLDPARQGNIAPLARMLVIGTILGEGAADAKSFIGGKQRPNDVAGRLGDDFGQGGGIGTISDAYNAIQGGQSGVLKFIAGPGLTDVANIAGSVPAAIAGKPKALAKAVTSNIPTVGPTLARNLFPSKGQTPSIGGLPIGTTQAADNNTVMPATNQSFSPSTPNSLIPDAQAASNAAPVQNTLTPLQIVALKKKITTNTAQEKTVQENNGPLGGIFGGGQTDAQKNAAIATLQGQNTNMQKQISQSTPQAQAVNNAAQYSLQADISKRSGDVAGWEKSTLGYIQSLQVYQKTLDPSTDSAKIAQLQKTITDLSSTANKYQSQGGFTKGKSGKVGIFGQTPATAGMRLRLPKPRIPRPKEVKLSNLKVSAVKAPSALSSSLKSLSVKSSPFPQSQTKSIGKTTPLKVLYGNHL